MQSVAVRSLFAMQCLILGCRAYLLVWQEGAFHAKHLVVFPRVRTVCEPASN